MPLEIEDARAGQRESARGRELQEIAGQHRAVMASFEVVDAPLVVAVAEHEVLAARCDGHDLRRAVRVVEGAPQLRTSVDVERPGASGAHRENVGSWIGGENAAGVDRANQSRVGPTRVEDPEVRVRDRHHALAGDPARRAEPLLTVEQDQLVVRSDQRRDWGCRGA